MELRHFTGSEQKICLKTTSSVSFGNYFDIDKDIKWGREGLVLFTFRNLNALKPFPLNFWSSSICEFYESNTLEFISILHLPNKSRKIVVGHIAKGIVHQHL